MEEVSALQGIKVVDWSQSAQGPDGAAMLADMGADVVHIESFKGDLARWNPINGGASALLPNNRHVQVEYYNRSKRGLAIDLTQPGAVEAIHALIKDADVFCTNLPLKNLIKFRMDKETLAKLNPNLIYASTTIYGHEGPDCELTGFDQSASARGGLFSIIGEEEDNWPGAIIPGCADAMAGFAFGFGILHALYVRERFGIVNEVRSSSLAGLIKLMAYQFSFTLWNHQTIRKQTTRNNKGLCTNTVYKCSDGKFLFTSGHRDHEFKALAITLGCPDIAEDPQWATGAQRIKAMIDGNSFVTESFAKAFATKPRAEWIKILNENRIPVSPINSLEDLTTDEMVLANNMIFDYDHPELGPMKYIGFPWQLDKTPLRVYRPAPHLGEHSGEVLKEWAGYTDEQVAKLKEDKVIL